MIRIHDIIKVVCLSYRNYDKMKLIYNKFEEHIMTWMNNGIYVSHIFQIYSYIAQLTSQKGTL